jgi:hypothetical protein
VALRLQRKQGADARARLGIALDLELSAHLSHDRPADRQPKAVPPGLGREEGLLNLRQVLLRDAAPGVLDEQLDRGAVTGRADRELIADAARIARVRDQVEQKLLDVRLNAVKRWKVWRELSQEPDAAPVEALAQNRQRILDRLAE